MPTLTPGGRKWLKAVHLVFVSMWVGGALTLVFMQSFLTASLGGELFGIDRSMRFVDDWVVIPGALGCLLSGLCYALFTQWGFFKHSWLTVKWVVTVGGILFGTFFLGPWLNSLAPISRELGLGALSDPAYMAAKTQNGLWSLAQVASLLFAIVLSTLKPWMKKTRK